MADSMQDIQHHVSVTREGKGICAKDVFRRVTTYDAAIVRSQAQFERDFGRNGFSKERTQRVIGEIPLAEFMEMQRLANASGDVLTGDDLKKYLQRNPEYMTVRRINSSAPPNIRVR